MPPPPGGATPTDPLALRSQSTGDAYSQFAEPKFWRKIAKARVKVPLSVGLDPIPTRSGTYSLMEAQESIEGWCRIPYVHGDVLATDPNFQCYMDRKKRVGSDQNGLVSSSFSGHRCYAGQKFHTWDGIVHDQMLSTLVPISASEGLTQNQVIISLVTSILGVGVLTLPSLMKLGGWVMVPTLAILTSLAFGEVGKVISEAIGMVEEPSGKGPPQVVASFEDFGRAALDDKGVLLVRSITTTGFAGTLVIFTILIGSNLSALFGGIVPMPTIMGCATLVLIGLAMIRDMRTVAKFMPIGIVASLSSCALICIKSLLDARVWEDWPADVQEDIHDVWPDEGWAGAGTIVAVLFSAYSVMSTVPNIRGEMKDKKNFLTAFQISIAIVCVMYLCVMVTGYWGYGNFVKENVVQSMMFAPKGPDEAFAEKRKVHTADLSSHILGRLMAFLVSIYLFLGFALFFACFFGAVQKFGCSCECCGPGTPMNVILRIIMVICFVAVGLTVPHFREVMAIMSSICCSCNNVFFPLLFAHILARRDGGKKPSLLRHFLHFLIFLLGVFCAVVGLRDSALRLISKMA